MANKRSPWAVMPLRWKVTSWFSAIMTVAVLIMAAMFIMSQTTFRAFERVQQSHMVYYHMQEALESERRAFEACVREDSQDNRRILAEACEVTLKAVEALPFDYQELGRDRYGRTWNIIQGYEGYCARRDAVMAADPSDSGYVDQMYSVLDMPFTTA